MKKVRAVLAIILAALMYSACSSDIENECRKAPVKLRSQSEAISIAENAYSIFNSDKGSRAGHASTAAASDVQIIKGHSSRGISNDTLLYIVNFENNEGYAVVSASQSTEALFGIADEGYFDGNEENINPNFRYYLDRASEYVANSSSVGITFPDTIINPNFPNPGNPTFPYTLVASKGPYVSLKWGQGSPYGDRFENGICGCVPSVFGMIATTVHWPTYMEDWRALSTHIGSECEEIHPDVHESLAQLMKMVADECEYVECLPNKTIYYMDLGHYELPGFFYGGECLGQSPLNGVDGIISVMNSFETDHHNALAFATTATTVSDYSNVKKIGHCWLIDGYKTIRPMTILTQERPLLTYIHCNWAYDGSSNGFFLPSSNFQTVLNYDNQNHTFDFSSEDDVTYYCVRKDLLVPAYNNR